jgi:serine-type D-Ala-D-Ala carboxypeptidase (penicillin-binding protein 5/6)
MNIITFIITIVIFPLNLLWIFPSEIKGGKNGEISVIENAQGKEGGGVQGVEKNKVSGLFSENAIPQAHVQPVKNAGIQDLAVPNAHSSLILDVDSGTILNYNNGRERRQIASLTKLMTALLVFEKVPNLEEEVTVDSDAVYVEGTRIGCPRSGYCISQRLKVGEKISVMNLLKAMLMNSANDAAVALAKHIGSTEENFVKMMNKKAEELELRDSHFCTASGLEIDGKEADCYSSAYDIARIAAYSMRHDLIWEIFRLPTNTTVTSADGTCSHQILNTDLVLDQIPNCLGGKTGFTPLAGHSLLLAASDATKKHKIIAVVLDDPYRWQDIRTMIDWTFKAYEWK